MTMPSKSILTFNKVMLSTGAVLGIIVGIIVGLQVSPALGILASLAVFAVIGIFFPNLVMGGFRLGDKITKPSPNKTGE